MDGLRCAAGTTGLHPRALTAGPESSVRATDKIKNPKQAGVVGPQFNEIKSRLASQRDETVWRVFVGMLGEDSFTGEETKRSILYATRLICRANQIHFDAPCFSVANGSMLPTVWIEISACLAIDVRQ